MDSRESSETDRLDDDLIACLPDPDEECVGQWDDGEYEFFTLHL
jgi:hypothetical protein